MLWNAELTPKFVTYLLTQLEGIQKLWAIFFLAFLFALTELKMIGLGFTQIYMK